LADWTAGSLAEGLADAIVDELLGGVLEDEDEDDLFGHAGDDALFGGIEDNLSP
jgi:hypothetical protein